VLSEALALIEERGHTDFTLREIARRIGVSHAAPYRHFEGRPAVLTELAASASLELAASVEAALAAAGEDLRGRFLAGGFAYVSYALEHPGSYKAMYAGEVDTEDAQVLAAKEKSFGLLLRFVEEAQRAGVFRPGDSMALARPVWAMHHGLASLAAAGAFAAEGPGALRAIIDDAHARLLDGLLVSPPKLAAAEAGRRPQRGSGKSARR
jgi:AcrR family transcriptional regulator